MEHQLTKATITVLLTLAIASCSSTESVKTLDAGCDLVCKNCGEVMLKCNQGLNIEKDSEKSGTGVIPSLLSN